MSKSHKGTKKTSSFINTDSPKYIERDCTGQSKHGSASTSTDAAHILSFAVVNTLETHSSGAPLGM
jgi:hypothetical protein